MLITIAFAIVVTMLALGGIVTAPWYQMPELGADGGKNIFTYLYHTLYGHGIWFEGMNYPYGEHIVYTDGQPILSVPLSYFKQSININTALTIMWWCVAASYVLSIVFCFKILRRFSVAPAVAIVFAGLITVCSPQVLRISGHYALSCCCVLPMLFYCTLQYHTTMRWKYLAYIFVMGCFSVFLHPYFAAVSLVWSGCYAVGYMFTIKGSLISKVRHVVPMLISTGAVLVIFGTFMKLTDPLAADRPTTPFGILNNCTHIKDIVSSGYSPFWALVKNHSSFSKISYGGEGYTYIGLATILALCFMVGSWLLKKLGNSRKETNDGFQPVWLAMAAMALLFGMGAPFIWHMEWLLDYASAFRQFRTLGRFSWIFYYIITIYGAVVIYNMYINYLANNKRVLAYAVLLAGIGIWAIEAAGYAKRTHAAVATGRANYDIFVSKNEVTWPQFLAAHHYTKTDFQAILVLPLFATGTEKLWISSDENISAWSVAIGIKAGIQLQLPMVDAMMSRSSWNQALQQVKIAGGPYAEKFMLYNLKTNKPFLLLHTDDAPLSPDQAYLLQQSTPLGHYTHCMVYACYPAKLRTADAAMADSAYNIAAHMQLTDTCIKNAGAWYVNHYDEHNYNATPFGIGAVAYAANIGEVICNIPIAPSVDKQLYEFSCWFRVNVTDYKSPDCVVEALDGNGSVIASYPTPTKESTDNEGSWILDDKKSPVKANAWLRCNAYVNLPAATRRVRCKMLNFATEPYMAMDELMLRPADATIVSRMANGQVMANNHLLKRIVK